MIRLDLARLPSAGMADEATAVNGGGAPRDQLARRRA